MDIQAFITKVSIHFWKHAKDEMARAPEGKELCIHDPSFEQVEGQEYTYEVKIQSHFVDPDEACDADGQRFAKAEA